MAASGAYSDMNAKRPLADSSSGAAQANNCVLTPDAQSTAYLTGFEITGLGATAVGSIQVTLSGSNMANTPTWTVPIPAGVTVGVTPLVVSIPNGISGSKPGQALTLNVPSFGSGNTVASACAHGFQQ